MFFVDSHVLLCFRYTSTYVASCARSTRTTAFSTSLSAVGTVQTGAKLYFMRVNVEVFHTLLPTRSIEVPFLQFQILKQFILPNNMTNLIYVYICMYSYLLLISFLFYIYI